MHGYDWDFGFGFGQRHIAHRGGAAYGREYQGGYDRSYRRGGPGGGRSGEGWGGGGWGGRRGYGAEFGQRRGGGFGPGAYGEQHPTFGGYPGGRQQGMYYGGREGRGGPGYGGQGGGGYTGGHGYDWPERGGWGRGGYDQGYVRQPFLPEAAYRRHPELNRPQRHAGDRWPAQVHDFSGGIALSDSDIEQAVRENLYQDTWVDAERIEVSVENGVITLRGEVDDYLMARYAWDDAWEAEGVRGVINQITVRTDQPAAEGHEQTVLQTSGGQEEERGTAGG